MNKKSTDPAQGLASPVEETRTRDSGQASGQTAAKMVEMPAPEKNRALTEGGTHTDQCAWFERTGKWLALWHADRAKHEAGRHRSIE